MAIECTASLHTQANMEIDTVKSVAVVAVPFPMQGHLNQLMHLSLLLASRGIAVHYAAPAPQLRQARARVHGWDAQAILSLHFHALDISTYPSPPPDPTGPSPYPAHLQPLFETFSADARAPLAGLLYELAASHRRVVVVHDFLNAFAAAEAARLPNGEAFGLWCVASSFHIASSHAGHRLLREHGLAFPADVGVTKEIMELVMRMAKEGAPGVGLVMNTCRPLEGEFIDALAEEPTYRGQKLFAIGPLSPLLGASARTPGQQRHECLDWLDKQPPSSVLYVSFGTSSTLRGEQLEELAAALRSCKQRFIWVLRDADRGDIFAETGENRHAKLLSEFLKETEGMGFVITDWAPQLEILAHGATAAFMSHCGWNSIIESLSHGKPILAWPMHSDQPWDAAYVCDYLKAGIIVRPWEKQKEILPAKAIQEAIEKAMLSEEGMAVRRRAAALGEAVRADVAEGGSSRKNLEDFVAYITR